MTPKLIRIPPIVPVTGDIYKGDALNRRPECEHLRDAILAAQTPCTLAINASWGAGKTVFLQMLREECKSAGMSCVYFDAWKNDFHPDALPPMIGQIEMQMQNQRKLPDKLIKFGRELCRKAPTLATLAALDATGGAVAANILKTMGKESDAVAEYVARQKAMENFRQALGNFAAPKSGESKPLVFFVDELDRCRPVFAVEVLEKIKHVFDVPGVFFVIAVNKEELQKILLSVYGEINPTLYLRKFFDFEFNLENRRDVVMTALDRLEGDTGIDPNDTDLSKFFPLMCRDFGLQLRDQEQAAAMTARALTLEHPSDFLPSVLVAFFTVLKFANPELYQKCLACVRQDPVDFPFVEIMDYYESVSGTQEVQERTRGPHRVPILCLQALRFNHDASYASELKEFISNNQRISSDANRWQLNAAIEATRIADIWTRYRITPRRIHETIEIGVRDKR